MLLFTSPSRGQCGERKWLAEDGEKACRKKRGEIRHRLGMNRKRATGAAEKCNRNWGGGGGGGGSGNLCHTLQWISAGEELELCLCSPCSTHSSFQESKTFLWDRRVISGTQHLSALQSAQFSVTTCHEHRAESGTLTQCTLKALLTLVICVRVTERLQYDS